MKKIILLLLFNLLSVSFSLADDTQNRDLTWGVLAVNFDRSLYRPGDEAHLQMGVLSNRGDTVCGADLDLKIRTPSGATAHFTTDDGSIIRDAKCGRDNVIDVPDYSARYVIPSEAGRYEVTFTAKTESGTKTITDHFDVTSKVLFEVKHKGPARINPLSAYPIAISIVSPVDWHGTVEERVPANFDIIQSPKNIPYDEIVTRGEEKIIFWRITLKANEEKTIGYSFDAPNKKSEFYLLGPLVFKQNDKIVFKETRQWQIANDSVVVDILTAGVSWSVPFDFDVANNTIEAIGGGGGAGGGGAGGGRGGSGGGAGGGGEYRKINNFNPGGTSVSYVIGAGGTGGGSATDGTDGADTTWNTTSLIAKKGLKGIKGVTNGAGGAGGAGGTGGTGAGGNFNGGAGANGGASSACCGGGGGGGGGAAGVGAVGGAGTAGVAAGASGGAGSAGGNGGAPSGGAGGSASSGNGGNGAAWTDTIDSSTGGAGGGGGGGNGATTGAGTAGGLPGNYGAGGGGGGGGDNASAGGAGKDGQQGVIVVTYTSTGLSVSGGTDASNGTVVKVAVNGSVQGQSATVLSGSYTITGIAIPAVNDIITVWLDNVADGSESTAVTKWSTGNVTGLDLYTGRLFIGSNQNTSLTIANLGLYDADDDEDIMHTSNSSALLVQGASNSYTGEILLIDTGDTLTVSTGESVTSETIRVLGTLTSSGTATYTLNGTSGILFYNNGTWTESTSTVNVTSSSGTPTLLSNNTTFHKLTINSSATVINAGATITMSSADAANKLYIQAGVFNDEGRTIAGTANGTLQIDAGATLCISGTVGGTSATCNSGAVPTTASTFPTNYTNGNITLATTSTVIYLADAATTVSSTPTYGNLKLTPLFDTTSRTYTAGGALTINGDFTITPDESGAGTPALTVNPAGTITVASGKTTTISRANSATATLDLRPSSTDYDLSTGLLNVATGGTLDAGSAASTITLTGTSGTLFTLGGTFTITSGTPTVVMNPDAAVTLTSGAITFYNLTLSPTITSGRTYTFGSGALTINGDFTINPTAASALALTVNMGAAITVASGKTTTITRTTSATSVLDLRPASTDYNLSTGLLNIATGGTLDASSAASTITLTGTSGTLFTLGGTFTITSGTPTVVMNPDAAVTLTSGAITFYNLSLTPAISSARTYTFGSGALTINGDFTIQPTASASVALTVNMGADITVAATKTTSILGSSLTKTAKLVTHPASTDYNLSTGLITINRGTLDAGNSSSTITLTGTSGTLFTTGTSGNFTQGTSEVKVTSASGSPSLFFLDNPISLHRLTINSTATVINLGAAITMSSANAANRLYIQAGVLNDGGNTIVGTANGTLVVDNGATLCISGTAAGTNATCNSGAVPTTASTFPTNYTNGNITLGTTSTVIYLADAAMTVSSTPTYGNLKLTPLFVTTSRTYTAAGALTINGDFTITPDESGAGTPALTFNPAGDITVASTKTTTISRANSATATLDLRPSATDYNLSTGSLSIGTGGTLDSASATSIVTVADDWTNAGTFTAGTSRVVLSSTTTATVGGGPTTFYDLTTSAAGKEIDFSITGTHIVTVSHTFTVAGSVGSLIKLYSTSGSTKWHFLPSGTASVDYADVKDGGCESGAISITPTHSTNSGNNDSCWVFSSIKTIDGLAQSSIKTVNGLAIGSMKARNALP